MAAFLGPIQEITTDVEVVPSGEALNFFPTGITYLADGEAGTLRS